MRFPVIILLLLAPFFLFAQEEKQPEVYDIIETMAGERYEGKIIYYEYGKLLTIARRDGSEITLATSEIRRVRYARERNAARPAQPKTSGVDEATEYFIDDWRNELTFRQISRKIRPSLAMMVHGGKQSNGVSGFFFDEVRTFGYGIEGMLHYRVADWLDLGAGAAFDRYNSSRGESTFSWLGDAQVLPSRDKNFAPYFRLTAGYGSPIKTDRNSFIDKEGGILLHPGIGLRFGQTDEIFYTLDFGYRILRTAYSLETFQGEERRSNNYRRLSLRLGANF